MVPAPVRQIGKLWAAFKSRLGKSRMPASTSMQTLFRYSGVDTLDEPITTTIVGAVTLVLSCKLTPDQARDLLSIYSKLVHVLYPRKSSGREVLRSAGSSNPV